MGIFTKRNKEEKFNKKYIKETRSIIKEYYGNDLNLFVWNYAQNIYSIPEVRTAIDKIAAIFSCIPIYHKFVNSKGDISYLKENDGLNYVLKFKPNPLQNSTMFWQNCITQLLLNSNLFIEPTFDESGKLRYLYPLPFKIFDFELLSNSALVKFYESKGGAVREKHNLNDLIYISKFCNLNGGTKNELGLYETVLQALETKIVNLCNPKKPRALLQSTLSGQGQLKERDKKGTMKDIQANFDENVDGLAYLDAKWTVTPINWQENDVNKDLMQFIVNIVYNYFGINDEIVNNKANETQMEMFIANTIKPLAQQFEQELTCKLFTRREIDLGHRVEFDVFALSVSTLQAKTQLFSVANRNGILSIDEAREYIGQPPLPNGVGKRYRVSADCVDITIADKYQLGKFGLENVSTGGEKLEDAKFSNKEVENVIKAN